MAGDFFSSGWSVCPVVVGLSPDEVQPAEMKETTAKMIKARVRFIDASSMPPRDLGEQRPTIWSVPTQALSEARTKPVTYFLADALLGLGAWEVAGREEQVDAPQAEVRYRQLQFTS
jgi:hypothetical protein